MIDLHMRITSALGPDIRLRVHHALAPATIEWEKARIRAAWKPYTRYNQFWTPFSYEKNAYDQLDQDLYLDFRITQAVNGACRQLADMGIDLKAKMPMWYMVATELRNTEAAALKKQIDELNGSACRYLKDLLAWERKYKRINCPTAAVTQSRAKLEKILTAMGFPSGL